MNSNKQDEHAHLQGPDIDVFSKQLTQMTVVL